MRFARGRGVDKVRPVSEVDMEKRIAAEAAAELVEDGMTVGLGTGSTVAHLLPALARRGVGGIRCVATSVATEEQARGLGIPVEVLWGLSAHPDLVAGIERELKLRSAGRNPLDGSPPPERS